YSAGRVPESLELETHICRHAAQRAMARLGARQISTRKAPVLFAAELARGFFGHMVAAVRGTSQYRRSSFLLDAMGEQVLPAFVQMHERPHLLRALASSPFDADGVATRA